MSIKNKTDFSLINDYAKVLQNNGNINLNASGELCTHRFTFWTSTPKISPEALPQLDALVSRVAVTAETEPALEIIKTEMAIAYFGRSQSRSWELLLKTSPMNLPFSPHVSQLEINSSHAPPSLHQKSAKLFAEIVQEAQKEGAKGHCHIEHALLVLAHRFLATYCNRLLDPTLSDNQLQKTLKNIYDQVKQQRKEIGRIGDSFYSTLGTLTISAEAAKEMGMKHLELAKRYATPSATASLILKDLYFDANSLRIALSDLQAFPPSNINARISIELTSALNFFALSEIRCSPKNREQWSQNLALRWIKDRIRFELDQAFYHHERLSLHQIELRSKITQLEADIENCSIATHQLFMAKVSDTTQAKATHELERLSQELHDTQQELAACPTYPNPLENPLISDLEDGVLNSCEVEKFKPLYHSLKQYTATLIDILPREIVFD